FSEARSRLGREPRRGRARLRVDLRRVGLRRSGRLRELSDQGRRDVRRTLSSRALSQWTLATLRPPTSDRPDLLRERSGFEGLDLARVGRWLRLPPLQGKHPVLGPRPAGARRRRSRGARAALCASAWAGGAGRIVLNVPRPRLLSAPTRNRSRQRCVSSIPSWGDIEADLPWAMSNADMVDLQAARLYTQRSGSLLHLAPLETTTRLLVVSRRCPMGSRRSPPRDRPQSFDPRTA